MTYRDTENIIIVTHFISIELREYCYTFYCEVESLQLQVFNSPFNQEQAELLNRLLPTLTESQKIWLSGYLAAAQPTSQAAATLEIVKNPVEELGQSVQSKPITKELTILYGSQTGNARGVANKVSKAFKEHQFEVNVVGMNDFKPNNLKKLQNLLIVVSTHGEGEPPDNAISFYEFLNGKRAPKLEGLQFSVLSLGDSSYEFFCKTGKDFDLRLEELGATRIFSRYDCDVDFEESANEWLTGVVQSLSQDSVQIKTEATEAEKETSESEYSRTNPFKAEVLENLNLNGRGSNKETRHIELSLESSNLIYEPGDSLGIYPENDPELVELLLSKTKWNADDLVTVNKQGDVLPLKEALTVFYEITVVTKSLLEKVGQLSASEKLQEILSPGNEAKVKEYIKGRDLIDLVDDFGVWGSSAQEFVSILRKIPVRLYSIASSLSANPDEVHLTIGTVRYEAHERGRKGVCSTQVAERIQPGDKLAVYVQHNNNFKLPENPDTPIIMVGPGTGVAPFRSFMQEREEIDTQGKSWMFFGDQHFVTDFLYQTEWQKWLKDGILSRMDVAFSRDGSEKVYVQDRMHENSKELFQWIQEGAYLYVCGDKDHMAKDVENTLIEIIEKEGKLDRSQAEEYVSQLRKQKRYQRDVY